jgi:SAM-dependent methyltransferase
LRTPVLDLGAAPPSNAYLQADRLYAPEVWFPLRLMVCETCWLVQTEDYAGREELFTEDYAYFSSYSASWLAHSKAYVEAMRERFELDADSMVVEVAANDGYLLQFVAEAGIPNYGIEPTASTARAAREKGIDIVERFFGVELGQELAAQGRAADLTVANNVLAHVPDINDFIGGFAALLKPAGVATFEFPHLMRMVAENQFDTAYHEHYSYLSLTAVGRIFAANGLEVFDVEQLPTHGGSLRVFAQRAGASRAVSPRVTQLLAQEDAAGLRTVGYYRDFQASAEKVKHDLTAFLIEQHRAGKTVAAYGAAAKGNTLLNFAGIRSDLLEYVVDRNPAKAGSYMPGSRIPIVGEDRLREQKPDIVLILPWNLKDEISAQLAYARDWGGKLAVAVPELAVF